MIATGAGATNIKNLDGELKYSSHTENDYKLT